VDGFVLFPRDKSISGASVIIVIRARVRAIRLIDRLNAARGRRAVRARADIPSPRFVRVARSAVRRVERVQRIRSRACAYDRICIYIYIDILSATPRFQRINARPLSAPSRRFEISSTGHVFGPSVVGVSSSAGRPIPFSRARKNQKKRRKKKTPSLYTRGRVLLYIIHVHNTRLLLRTSRASVIFAHCDIRYAPYVRGRSFVRVLQ